MKMKKYLVILVVLVLLLLTRLVDMKVVWNLGMLEIDHMVNSGIVNTEKMKDVYLERLGFSGDKNAEKRLQQLIGERKEKIIAVAFYNFWHPAVFFIHNKGTKESFVIPWPGIDAENGTTKAWLYKCDLVTIESGSISKTEIAPVVSLLLTQIKDFFRMFFYDDMSFICGGFEYTKYLKIIHLAYFFFPLLIILFFSFYYSKSVYISLWYYFIMLFLFYSKSYAGCPMIFLVQWVYGLDKVPKIIFLLAIVGQIFVFYFLIRGIKHGRKVIKEKGLDYKEKIIIWYILLLPVILRF